MFEIEEFTNVKLTNFNPRREKHGPESVPAADMNFEFDQPNHVLSYFDGGLLSSLYRKTAANETEQETLDGVEPVSDMPTLRFPKMNPVRWDDKLAGYTLKIDYGLGGKSILEVDGCDVGKFTLDCKEGGTVNIRFQVQCSSGLTEKMMGKLSLLIGETIKITLTAPEATE